MLTTFGRVTNEVPGLPDAVVTGLAAMLGAGLLVGIAPASSAAGGWMLAGLVLAALVAVVCGLSTSERTTPLATLGRTAGAVAIAGAFGRYVLPEHPIVAAVMLLGVATMLIALGFRSPRWLIRAGVLAVLAMLAVFVAACLAIEPPPNAAVADDPAGLPAATAFLIFAFLGTDRKLRAPRHRMIAIGVALVVYLAVAGAALYQLGGARLGFSPVPLRDALAAADASGLDPVLSVGAALAAVLALLGVLEDLLAGDEPWEASVAALAMPLGLAFLTVPALILVAVALMVGHHVLGLVRSRRASGRTPPRSTRS